MWARRDASFPTIRRLGFAVVADTDLERIVRGAGAVVLCTPVETMPELAERMLPHLAPDALVTDAGSSKTDVVATLEGILGARFVGAHPIAGSDRTGIEFADPDLFEGASCVLTPTTTTSANALAAARELWSAAGCHLVEMPPDAHDRALARTSHLPHVAAAALAAQIASGTPDWTKLVGGGYRDTTRIAASDPSLWTGILLSNRGEVSSAIAEFTQILQTLRASLEAGDADAVRALLSEGRAAREHFDAS